MSEEVPVSENDFSGAAEIAKQRLGLGEQTAQQPSTEAIIAAVDTLASAYHEDWRKTRLDEETGQFEPRVKPTKDEAWIAKHGATEVDIANTPYEDLPSDWQAENKAAAEVVVHYMHEANGTVDLTDPSERMKAGSVVHDAWLSRNTWASGGELDKPFDQLPLDEQNKDIRQVEIALETFKS